MFSEVRFTRRKRLYEGATRKYDFHSAPLGLRLKNIFKATCYRKGKGYLPSAAALDAALASVGTLALEWALVVQRRRL
jgi:hypothetical protein